MKKVVHPYKKKQCTPMRKTVHPYEINGAPYEKNGAFFYLIQKNGAHLNKIRTTLNVRLNNIIVIAKMHHFSWQENKCTILHIV